MFKKNSRSDPKIDYGFVRTFFSLSNVGWFKSLASPEFVMRHAPTCTGRAIKGACKSKPAVNRAGEGSAQEAICDGRASILIETRIYCSASDEMWECFRHRRLTLPEPPGTAYPLSDANETAVGHTHTLVTVTLTYRGTRCNFFFFYPGVNCTKIVTTT